MHTPVYVNACHLDHLIDPRALAKTISHTVAILTKYEFDAIAFRGLSGALIAPVVAMQMGKSLIAVRKGESCHSPNMIEGDVNALTYVIVDDFVSSGETCRKIAQHIYDVTHKAKCIGICETMYADPDHDEYTGELKEVKITLKSKPAPLSVAQINALSANAPSLYRATFGHGIEGDPLWSEVGKAAIEEWSG